VVTEPVENAGKIAADIADALKEHGFTVAKSQVIIDKSIRIIQHLDVNVLQEDPSRDWA